MSYGSRSDYLYNDKNGVIAKSIQPGKLKTFETEKNNMTVNL